MAHDEHHANLIKEVAEIFEPIMSTSPQAIYIYLDDTHKICNENFVDLVGYDSIDEWVKNETPLDDIAGADQDGLIEAYREASEDIEANNISATIITKGGSEIETDIILIPFKFKDEVFVVHFISPIN